MQVTQNKITRQASSDLWLLLKFLTGLLRVLLHFFYRVLMLLDNAQSRFFLRRKLAECSVEWAPKYHSAAVSLCANVKSKVQGNTLRSGLILYFYRKMNFFPFSVTRLTLLNFLLCSNVFRHFSAISHFCIFYCRAGFS